MELFLMIISVPICLLAIFYMILCVRIIVRDVREMRKGPYNGT